jgi:hypothetical protein
MHAKFRRRIRNNKRVIRNANLRHDRDVAVVFLDEDGAESVEEAVGETYVGELGETVEEFGADQEGGVVEEG